jgi:hypothetical protein
MFQLHLVIKHQMKWEDDHDWWVCKDPERDSFGLFQDTIPELI